MTNECGTLSGDDFFAPPPTARARSWWVTVDGTSATSWWSPRPWCLVVPGTSGTTRSGASRACAAPGAQALAEAGRGISEIDVFEVHDAFTIGEIITLEVLGVADIGAGGNLAVSGHTARSGSQPVNPSGGMLSRGHPLGATGTAQLAEIVWQLRGDAEARQVARHGVGMVETMGGGAAGMDGNACVVTVLSV